MRQPIQVLVIPFREIGDTYKFGIFKRADASYWQFIAGGVENFESVAQAAIREAFEEAGISSGSSLLPLESVSCMPANIFYDHKNWPKNTFVVKEYSFGIKFMENDLTLSKEHTEFKWCTYDEAMSLLKWDSNKTALWELSQRLMILKK